MRYLVIASFAVLGVGMLIPLVSEIVTVIFDIYEDVS